MSLFTCPVCGGALEKTEKTYRCSRGHAFDAAAEGYVNLLPANRMNSRVPGDDPDMVRARARFLERGYYAPLRDALEKAAVRCVPPGGTVLDLGCGEGYYACGLAEALDGVGGGFRLAGVDIAKTAVRLAAKRDRSRSCEWAVASVFHLPVADGAADLALNCFSPLCAPEILRVLRPGGRFLYVVPGPRHLWGLKTAVYDQPYENEEKETHYPGLTHRETIRVEAGITLSSREDIESLFRMTPYFWKTSPGDQARLDALESLSTPVEFHLHLYQKNG